MNHEHRWKLRSWISIEKLEWTGLSENSSAIHLLEAKIDWNIISCNLSAIHLLQENPNKINWYNLSLNPSAIHL